MSAERRIRSWPEGVDDEGTTRKLAATYRKAFDADPGATFCAGVVAGLTIVVARGATADRLQQFVVDDLNGVIERDETDRLGRAASSAEREPEAVGSGPGSAPKSRATTGDGSAVAPK